MAAKLSEELGEQVTCAICLQHFSDPRLLPCLHTYCRQCLQDLLAKGQRKDAVACPECREEVQIIFGDVTRLKVNFWINNLLSLLAIHSTEEQDGDRNELTCENCDTKEAAKERCVDCCMFLCEFCSTAHKRYLATKGHQLMTLDEMKNTGIPVIEKQVYCTKHKGEVKKLFCKTCEELICRDCTIIDHRDHQFNFVEDVADQHKQLFKTKVEKASDIKNEVEAVLKSVQEMKESVEERLKATEKVVDDFIDEQIKALEDKRRMLRQEAQKIAATKIKELAAQEDGLAMHLTGLESAIEFTEKVLTNGGNSDVLSVSKQLTTRLTQLSEKPFSKYPCQLDKISLDSDKSLFHDFTKGAKIVDGCLVDHDKCSVAQVLDGVLVQNPDSVTGLESAIEFTEKVLTNGGNSDVLSVSKQLTTRLTQLSEKPFSKYPCQLDKISLDSDKSLFHDFTKGAKIVDGCLVDHDKCSVAQVLDGVLVQNPDSVIHAKQEEILEFVVQIKNSFGEKLKFMANKIQAVKIPNFGQIEETLPIESLVDDTYSFSVVYEGRCNIHVTVNGNIIPGCPINIHKQAQRRGYGYYTVNKDKPRKKGARMVRDSREECCPQDQCYQRAQNVERETEIDVRQYYPWDY